MTEQDELVAAVEAVLFAAGEPVHPKEIAAAIEGPDEDAIRRAIELLSARYAEGCGGLLVEQVAGAYRLATKPAVAALVRQFFRQRNRTRLSPAALETLAIVAYRQPATVPEIQAIRGVDPSAALKNLLEKKLVRILGRKKVVGNPLLYGTTKQFLVHFGLNRLEDLPSIEEFDQFVGALDETPGDTAPLLELEFEPEREPVGVPVPDEE
jgi:segregation and condensation protein B